MAEDFDTRSATWDDKPERWERARRVANVVRAAIEITGRPVTVELGSGTGMLARCLSDLLGPATLLDSSEGMIEVARQALAYLGLTGWRALVADLDRELPGGPYQLALSQLALHHVSDPAQLLHRLHSVMVPGGWVALADLDHDPKGEYHEHLEHFTGHHGFPREQFAAWMGEAGFTGISFHDVGPSFKEIDGQHRKFSMFLAVAQA